MSSFGGQQTLLWSMTSPTMIITYKGGGGGGGVTPMESILRPRVKTLTGSGSFQRFDR